MARIMPKRRKPTIPVQDLKVQKAIDQFSALRGLIHDAHAAAHKVPILPKRPEDSFTLQEYRDELGLAEDTAYGILRRLMREGKYDRVMAYGSVPAQNATGFRLQAMWHYFPTGKGDVAPR